MTVQRPKCIASGACVLAAPEVFDQDEDGIVVLLDDHPTEEHHDEVREAVRACPAAVIEAFEPDVHAT
nr:ferredoxin [Capillimicrobium parvum]